MALARSTEYTGAIWWHPFHMLKDIATGYQEGGADYIFALLTGYRESAPAYQREDSGKLIAIADSEAANAPGVVRCASVTHAQHGEGKDTCQPLQQGMNYNVAFPGHQIAMMKPLSDGVIEYKKDAAGQPGAPETATQNARDVVDFLSWAAEPSHDQRKRLGWQVLLYLLITTVLLYLAKKRIWQRIKH